MRPAMDLSQCANQMARSCLPKLPNTMFLIVIHCVLNGKDMVEAPKQLHGLYTDVGHWEELSDCIDWNAGPKEPYVWTSTFMYILEQDELDEDCMGLYTNGKWNCTPYMARSRASVAFQKRLCWNLNIIWI